MIDDITSEESNFKDIERINIEKEMESSFLDYAMSVIVSRALPMYADGHKPVHRRIIYAMKKQVMFQVNLQKICQNCRRCYG